MKLNVRRQRRVLFVFARLVVGGEETEVRLLAKHLDPARYCIDIVPCFRGASMTEQTHRQLEEIGIAVDQAPYELSFEDTVAYLAEKIPAYDLVVACQGVPDIYPALDRLANPPPLIEHGGLVSEVSAMPKHHTTRYVGVCATIREAAADAMPDRPEHALEIPSMVDLAEFNPDARAGVRQEWGTAAEIPVLGWVGRLDRKKRVEDFIQAASIVRARHPQSRFMVIGGPDAYMPEYATELRSLATRLGLSDALSFLGDRSDVPRLMMGLDALVWLSRDEGMPHVIAEAGAAALVVIATRDNGSVQQIVDGVSGLFVPNQSPGAVAEAMDRVIDFPQLRLDLGRQLRRKVEREYAAHMVARRWEQLFDEVLAERA